MDANGARQLAARIKAGVSVGMRVEVVDPGGDARLSIGDRGVVEAVDDQGVVTIAWDHGFTHEIDPVRTPVRRLAA